MPASKEPASCAAGSRWTSSTPNATVRLARRSAVLVDSRLVTADDETVEVAHEALLREWPRLRGWLEEDAEGRRLHQHLIHAARDWQAAGRDRGELYRGARLAAALDWSAAHERRAQRARARLPRRKPRRGRAGGERQRRTNRRLRALLAGVAAAAGVGGRCRSAQPAWRGARRGAGRGRPAPGRRGADPGALSTVRCSWPGPPWRSTRHPPRRATSCPSCMRTPAALGIVDHGRRLFGAAVSPDGRLMATGDDRGKVTVYEAATREPLGKPYLIRRGLSSTSASRPTATPSPSAHSIRRTRAERGGRPDRSAHAQAAGCTWTFRRSPSRAPFVAANVVFLADTRDVVVAADPWRVPGCATLPALSRGRGDGRRRKTVEGRQPSALLPSAPADGERIYLTSAGDSRTWEIDPDGLRVRRTYPVGDFAGAVSPDGSVFALGGKTGRIRLLDLRSGQVRSFRGATHGSVLRMRSSHPMGARS